MANVIFTCISDHLGNYTNHFAAFGVICLGYLTIKIVKSLTSVTFRSTRRSIAIDLTKNGRWAVITGSTDGIGKSYALQLAEKGMDIVLISRNPEKLSKVVEEIGQRSKVQVQVIAADFKRTDIYENIRRQLDGLDIGILVNNVGMVNTKYAYHCDLADLDQFCRDIINVNILSCVMMTNIVLPDMLERKRGIIINIGSGAGLQPMPFLSAYSATKAFIHQFSKALNIEYSPHGVKVQLVVPNMVESNMSRDFVKGGGKSGLAYPTSDVFVKKAIQTIGRESVTIPYWLHELENLLIPFVPESFFRSVMLDNVKKMEEFYKKM